MEGQQDIRTKLSIIQNPRKEALYSSMHKPAIIAAFFKKAPVGLVGRWDVIPLIE
jgi:hypothetical protein